MKQETIDLLKFGAFMTMLAVLLVYVIQSVLLGKQLNSQAISNLAQIHVDSENGSLKDLKEENIILPTATVLALMEYNYKVIDTVTCYVCDNNGLVTPANDPLCVTSHLAGNVRILVTYDAGNGLYNVTINN